MKKYFLIFAIVGLVSVGLWKFVDANGQNIFNGCAKTTDGSLYLIGSLYPNQSCIGTDKAVTWNKRGPVGPAGPVGPTGPQGPAGTNGTGSSLHLYDANNQDLGVFTQTEIPMHNSNTYVSFNGAMDLFFRFSINDYLHTVEFMPMNEGSLLFESNNCTGAPVTYAGSTNYNGIVHKFISNGISHYYTVINNTGTIFIPRVAQSRLDSSPNQCIQLQTNIAESLQLQEITLPFIEPIAWPLHIQ